MANISVNHLKKYVETKLDEIPENDYIQLLFLIILERNSTKKEIDHCLKSLLSNDKLNLLEDFLNSQEFNDRIKRKNIETNLYEISENDYIQLLSILILGRPMTKKSDIDFWLKSIHSHDKIFVLQQFLKSGEFDDRIKRRKLIHEIIHETRLK